MSAHGLIERKGKDQIASRTFIKSVGRHTLKVAGEREILSSSPLELPAADFQS